MGSGANVVRVVGSTECDLLLSILGLPARLTGGGTGGAEAAGIPFLRGSADGVVTVLDCKNGAGLDSTAGVELRLGILKDLVPLGCDRLGLAAAGESRDAWGIVREGKGECIWVSAGFGGD